MNGKGERVFESLTDMEIEVISDIYSDPKDNARIHRQVRIIVTALLLAALAAAAIIIAVKSSKRRPQDAPIDPGKALWAGVFDQKGEHISHVEPRDTGSVTAWQGTSFFDAYRGS